MVSENLRNEFTNVVEKKIKKEFALQKLLTCDSDNRLLQYWYIFNDCSVIGKDTFVEYVSDIKKQIDNKDELCKEVEVHFNDSYVIDVNTVEIAEIVLTKLLVSCFRISDEEANNEVMYMMCDCDWFSDDDQGVINNEDGKEYKVSNFSEWYDYLKSEYGREL